MTIQIKNSMSYVPNEYIETTNGDIVTLTLTNIDLELFFKHYDVKNLTYHSGWKFKQIKGLFDEYIDIWFNHLYDAITAELDNYFND